MPATGPLILATLPIVGTVLGWYFERAAIYGGPVSLAPAKANLSLRKLTHITHAILT